MPSNGLKDQKPNEERIVLIVDDEPTNLDLLEAILRPEGYQIHRGSDGEQAVKMVAALQPDIVILDVRMPVKNGFEACREIKRNASDLFVPVILLTNLSDSDSQVEGLDAGADEYLIKPPRRAELLARVRAMLRIRDLHKELVQSNHDKEKFNQRLLQAQKIIQEDLRQVGQIQKSFLPREMPYHPEIRFGRYYGPCETAGGDYFDIIEIGRSLWGLLIADVTGHGAPAAVVMAITHTLMHSFANSFRYPSTALKVANEKLNSHLAPTFYVTMFYGILDLHDMTFRYSSAGHEPMMIYRAESNTVESLSTKFGFPLKLVESDSYDEAVVTVEPFDKLILFTDGLVERRDEHGNLFSPERLRDLAIKYKDLHAQEFVDMIINEAKAFAPGESFKDDVTLFVIERVT